MIPFVPVNQPLLDGNESKYLQECIETGWISSEGPFVSRLERDFSAVVGRRWGIAVCNGSAALEAAVAALRLKRGDEVIMPTFTIISCAAAVIRSGAHPVLVDADARTWNMNVNEVEAKISSRTKAIMVVHIYGLPTEMEPLLAIAKKHNLRIIEDSAEMHGATYGGLPCGSFGDLSTFSFYPNKLVTTGEGGIILTDDEALAERCRSLRNLCFQANRRFVHDELGWNLRMSNLQAAVGVAQLERLDNFVKRKRYMGRLYTQLLQKTPGIELPVSHTSKSENIYWVFGVVLAENVSFDAQYIIDQLAARGIGSRPFFWPMHEQPVFRKIGLFAGESYPVAERLARRGFYLPSGIGLTEEQIRRAADELKDLLA